MRDMPSNSVTGKRRVPAYQMPEWPTPGHIMMLIVAYGTLAFFAMLLAVVVLTLIARPLWALLFVAGALAGAAGRWVYRSGLVPKALEILGWQRRFAP